MASITDILDGEVGLVRSGLGSGHWKSLVFPHGAFYVHRGREWLGWWVETRLNACSYCTIKSENFQRNCV